MFCDGFYFSCNFFSHSKQRTIVLWPFRICLNRILFFASIFHKKNLINIHEMKWRKKKSAMANDQELMRTHFNTRAQYQPIVYSQRPKLFIKHPHQGTIQCNRWHIYYIFFLLNECAGRRHKTIHDTTQNNNVNNKSKPKQKPTATISLSTVIIEI